MRSISRASGRWSGTPWYRRHLRPMARCVEPGLASRRPTGVTAMRRDKRPATRALATMASAAALAVANAQPAWSSDHFDSPAMTANPQADIGDVYAWTASDGQRLNLAMTIAGHSFSDRLQYILR